MNQPLSFDWSLQASDTPDAYDQYREAMSHLCQVSDPAPGAQTAFVNRTRTTIFSQGVIGRGLCLGQTLTRSMVDIRRSPLEAFMIMRNAAPVVGDVDGRAMECVAGGIHLTDLSRPSTVRLERIDLDTLMVPREAVPGWYLAADHHGRALNGDQGAVRLLGHHLQRLQQEGPSLTDGEGGAAIQALFVVLREILGGEGWVSDEEGAALMRSIHLRASRVIERSITDPDLSAGRLARDAGVSRSVLYRAFAPHGGVARHIQRRRLEHAYQALARGRTRRAVSEVAERFGFVSQAHFSRQFRTRFGHSPSQVPLIVAEPSNGGAVPGRAMRYDAIAAWLRRA